MSEDPIAFAAGDANLYRYVGNGPVNGTDPSGLFPYGMGGPEDPPGAPWKPSPPPRQEECPPKTYPIGELDDRFGPGIKPITDRLREIQQEIGGGGGTVAFFFPWDTPGKDGYRCEEADALVQDRLRDLRNTGWEYEHEEYDGWGWFWGDGDHNWGHMYGPGGEEFYIDFWLNEDTPILFTRPR